MDRPWWAWLLPPALTWFFDRKRKRRRQQNVIVTGKPGTFKIAVPADSNARVSVTKEGATVTVGKVSREGEENGGSPGPDENPTPGGREIGLPRPRLKGRCSR